MCAAISPALHLHASDRLISAGWFGPPPYHPRLASRVGDYTLVMKDNWTIKDWLPGEKRFAMLGVHGGISSSEMRVPWSRYSSDGRSRRAAARSSFHQESPMANDKTAHTDRLIAEAVRNRLSREAGYRQQALKIYPWICGRCSREFTHQNLRELTVHHRNHNHDDNPSDGSNWELLCLYCHDNEHARQLDAAAARQAGNQFARLLTTRRRRRRRSPLQI
jgi:hypothetical protein